MDLGLADRVVVVTGGSQGIGRAAVAMFLAEGARVAFCARGRERLDAAAAELGPRHGERLLAVPCDVLERDQVAAFRDAVHARFGPADVLVNNAGQGLMKDFATTTDAEWEHELRLKLFSVIHPTRAFLPDLERSRDGAIVIVNALLARQPETYMACTSAARAGVLNLAKSLSHDLAPKGVRVNSLLLGLIESEQWQRRYDAAVREGRTTADRAAWLADIARDRKIPLGRLGVPAEPAAAIVFLASPLAAYITGAALEVSGGVSRFA